VALARRSGRDMSGVVWPGYVDAVTSLLMVLFFVLTIFLIVQFVLRETITGQESELDRLSDEVSGLARALGLEQQRAFGLEERVGALTATLGAARDEAARQSALIASLQDRVAAQEGELSDRAEQITAFEAEVAALIVARDRALATGEALRDDLADAEAARVALQSEQDALSVALAEARDRITAQDAEAARAAAEARALEAALADSRAEAAATDATLAQTLAALGAAEERAAGLATDLAASEAALSDAEAARLAEAAAAEALRARLSGVQAELTEAERRRLAEVAAAEALRARLQSADTELTAMTLALEEARARAEETLTLLAAAEAARAAAEGQATSALSEAERRAALLAAAEGALADQTEASTEAQRQTALLNEQVAALRTQLGELQAIVDDAVEREAAQAVRIEALSGDLNVALARVAAEERARAQAEAARADAEAARAALEIERAQRLEEERQRLQDEAAQLARFQSDFFAGLSRVLEGREGVRVEGDRFVFSSEVLFAPAQVDLLPEGRVQIARVAEILTEVADQIPPGIDWVVRVDGHTDRIPLSGTGRYRNNWELSQGRALSVVEYMVDELGFPPERLAATGFGEYQPIDHGESAEALARNRRIELKLTER